MSYQSERESFIATMITEGLPLPAIRKVLRHASTIQRLSEAECNGDYPCDNGERKTYQCSECDAGYVPSALKAVGKEPNRYYAECHRGDFTGPEHASRKDAEADMLTHHCDTDPKWNTVEVKLTNAVCPSCRAQQAIMRALNGSGHTAAFQGDPRGACVKIVVPSGKTDDWGRTGICVPTR